MSIKAGLTSDVVAATAAGATPATSNVKPGKRAKEARRKPAMRLSSLPLLHLQSHIHLDTH